MLSFHPCMMAASAALLVLQNNDMQWNSSLTFWSSYQPSDLLQCRQKMIGVWRSAYEAGRLKRPGIVFRKFNTKETYMAASAVPIAD